MDTDLLTHSVEYLVNSRNPPRKVLPGGNNLLPLQQPEWKCASITYSVSSWFYPENSIDNHHSFFI